MLQRQLPMSSPSSNLTEIVPSIWYARLNGREEISQFLPPDNWQPLFGNHSWRNSRWYSGKAIYKKIPKNTGMVSIYVEQTAEEIGKNLDTAHKACKRAKFIIALVRQPIRISTSYGPNRYVYRIDSRDKETTAPYDHTTSDRQPSDVTAKTPPHVDRCECCGRRDIFATVAAG